MDERAELQRILAERRRTIEAAFPHLPAELVDRLVAEDVDKTLARELVGEAPELPPGPSGSN